jgi:hypothetical protein
MESRPIGRFPTRAHDARFSYVGRRRPDELDGRARLLGHRRRVGHLRRRKRMEVAQELVNQQAYFVVLAAAWGASRVVAALFRRLV